MLTLVMSVLLADPNPQLIADIARQDAMKWRVIAVNDRPTDSAFDAVSNRMLKLKPSPIRDQAIAAFNAAGAYRDAGDSALSNGDNVVTVGDDFYAYATAQGYVDATATYTIALKRFTSAGNSLDAASNSLSEAMGYVIQAESGGKQ